MATTPTIVVGRNNWGIKNENLLGYYQSDDGFFVKREFAATRGGGTNGTFVGSNGFIQTAASGNLPRIDFYGGSPALLVEPSAQNLYQRSEDFANAYWGKTNCAVPSNQAVAPDGTSTAGKLIMGNGILPNAVNQSGFNRTEVVTSSAYRFSIFAKSAEFTGFRVRENALEGAFLDVNLSNGTITNGSVVQFISPLAENYGNGWYRISWTSPTITNLNKYTIRVGSTGDGVSGIFVWGAQVETSSVATSYIPTTTGSVTRNADAISLTGATDYIGQTEGTLYAEVDMRVIPQFIVPISIDVGTVNEYLILAANSDGAFRVVIKKSTGSQTQLIISSSNPVGVYKLALAYKNGDYALSINGATPLTSSDSTNYPTGTFSRVHLSLQAYGVGLCRTLSAAIYNKRLPNDQLQALTTL